MFFLIIFFNIEAHLIKWTGLLFASLQNTEATLCFFLGGGTLQPQCGSQWQIFIIPWCALSGACRQRFRDRQGLADVTNSFYPSAASFSPHHLNWKCLVEFFFPFFSFFFSFYYGVTIINPTIKIPFEQENKPVLRTSMYFLGSTPE